MSTPVPRHRAAPPRQGRGRRVAPRTRPRYGRIASFAGAFAVTVLAIAAGVGLVPDGSGSAEADELPPRALALGTVPLDTVTDLLSGAGSLDDPVVGTVDASNAVPPERSPDSGPAQESTSTPPAVPADSGSGRRVVFDQSDQRVWLVGERGKVLRTYLVSGSVYDNLQPGTYQVYSTSRHAIGIDDSGTMEYMVRFTRGENAAIGFHSIPEKDGRPLQTRKQLGTPLSHGCIRQDLPDAVALWEFAPVGTTVVVTA